MKSFIWGVAHAAFQVEGSPSESDWKAFSERPGAIMDGQNAHKATDFWNQYERDFKLAKDLQCQAFRLSLAWERIIPSRGQIDREALRRYKNIFKSLQDHGLIPFLTLQHFVLPHWLAQEGGYSASSFVEDFKFFTETVVSEFPDIQYWITFNEPMVVLKFGYIDGLWPPNQKNPKLALTALSHIAEAHSEAYSIIKSIIPDSKIGIAQHWRPFHPRNKWNPLHLLACKIADKSFNHQLLQYWTNFSNKLSIPGGGSRTLRMAKQRTLDFIGINYYGRLIVSISTKPPFLHIEEGPGEKTDLGWEIYPEGLSESIVDVSKYELPIYITENGLADSNDRLRSSFLKSHAEQIKSVIQSNIDLRGYFHWTLIDNFEWTEGLKPKFGLYAIDHQNNTITPRSSVATYKEIIRQTV